MAFSIQTNVNSLIAQENLRVNSEFQSRTIQRLTSGFRINQSGDDAAGLAIANKFRSDVAELTQGVRNANDGISTLQIVDGGMNNISKMLDRLKTLATQSASGTYTGDRTVLNDEFSSLLKEIDRQAQAIGLDQNGQFAKSLSVFIGGGKTQTGAVDIDNGSVTINLSKSTVDSNSLGLKGYQASGTAGVDIGTGSAAHSVSQIVGDAANTTATSGYTDFYFSGAGFADNSKVKVSVNVQNVSDVESLVTAINSAITAAGAGGTQGATAFKKAGIVASVNTDASGGKQLAFTSSTAAFQVQAGDKMANAMMGNVQGGTSQGADIATTVVGAATAGAATAFVPTNVTVRITGGGLAEAVDLTFDAGSNTTALAITDLTSKVAGNASLKAAGITVSGSATNPLTFTSALGEQFNVMVTGDVDNNLGLGSFVAGAAGAADYTTITGAAYNSAAAAGVAKLEFSFNGGVSNTNSVSVDLGVAGDTDLQGAVDALNTAISLDTDLQAAGLRAKAAGGAITIESTNGTSFRVTAGGSAAAADLGFGVDGATFNTLTVGASGASTVKSGGANSTSLDFTAIKYGDDDQTITLTANDTTGSMHSATLTLRNDATGDSGLTIDEAVHAINTALQQGNDTTMQKIVAVKENVGGTEKISFLSSLSAFKVTAGATAGAEGVTAGTKDSATLAGGATVDISTQSNAQAAVTALASAVGTLGQAQAAVGKAQNQLGYAVNLAQSQISNFSAAESRIRDADIASEAANLTKAQVLQQASMAAMAQANSAPQAVLALLRG